MSRYRHQSGSRSQGESVLECKAAYLCVLDDVEEHIESKQQLKTVLQQAGRNPSTKTINKYWTEDTDSISFDEFCDICKKEPVTSSEELMKAFTKIDINRDGYISLDELHKIMTTRGERMSRDEVRAMIAEVDENDDGRLDYKEFCNMLMDTTEECRRLSRKVMERKEKKKLRNGTRKLEENDRPVSPPPSSSESPRRASSPATSDHLPLGSSASLVSIKSGTRSVTGSTEVNSIRPVAAPRKINSAQINREDDYPRAIPRASKMKAGVGGKKGQLHAPSSVRDWAHVHSKGCFFLDEGDIISHQYKLTVSEDTDTWITIQPTLGGTHPVDTDLYIVKERSKGDSYVAFTERRDHNGKAGVRVELTEGTYLIYPFTTGCCLKLRKHEPRTEEKLLKKNKAGNMALSRPFQTTLEQIFDLCDLDGNGRLSREEFGFFNLRTSGDIPNDSEWSIVKDAVHLEKGEITKAGFIQLNEMEVEDNKGDLEDLWVTPTSMGFNKQLVQDESCPFRIDVYTDTCSDPELEVTGLESGGEKLDNAVCKSVIDKGEATKIRSMKDLIMYIYTGDSRASIVLENKARSSVIVSLDCTKSRNCIGNRGSLEENVTVLGHSSVVGYHLVPKDNQSDWSVRCSESIIK